MTKSSASFLRRKARVRYSVKNKASGKYRLSVHRTSAHVYAQVIDDGNSVTVASASSLADLKEAKVSGCDAAYKIGELIAKRCLDKQVSSIVFDRGGYIFHGRVKAIADGARSVGLNF